MVKFDLDKSSLSRLESTSVETVSPATTRLVTILMWAAASVGGE